MVFRFRRFACAALVLIVAVGWLCFESAPQSAHAEPKTDTAINDTAKNDTAKPVEPDLHEFMEYIFEPTFKRLKPAMAAEPADRQGWKTIKADSLILAEGGNLLLSRQPDDDKADWVKHSVQVREHGGRLYRAAKAKDYAAARKSYEGMIQNCNACHQQFADGKHILTP